MENRGNCIELVETLDEIAESPIKNILKNSKIGNSVSYHWCVVVPDLEKTIEKMQKEKFKLIVSPQEAIAFHNKRVEFVMNKEIGIIKLLEE